MYGPSFFTGSLITRYGKIPVTVTGIVLLALAGAIALTGISVTYFWLALIVLGLGWNLGFIGATAMVTDCYRPEEKSRVQAFNDFLVFGCVAIASFSSGHVLAAHGWAAVAQFIYPALAVVLFALLWLAWHGRQHNGPAR
jgi:MFS family permease